jgi:hypothetical protein
MACILSLDLVMSHKMIDERKKIKDQKYRSGTRFAPRVFVFQFCDVTEVMFKSNLVTHKI